MSLRNRSILFPAAQTSSSNVQDIPKAKHRDGVFGRHLSRMTNSLKLHAFLLITIASPRIWPAMAAFQVVSYAGSSAVGCSPPQAFSQRSMLALLH